MTSEKWISEPLWIAPPLLKPGDRWSLVGDSITQDGSYYAWIYLYFVTRFPGLRFSLANCGISGDSAAGALRRYAWDIQPTCPTLATVMFGMNDVDRLLYTEAPLTAKLQVQRRAAMEAYRSNLEQLISQLQRDGARVILMSPSIYDETVRLETPLQSGVNGALAECTQIMQELAARYATDFIDCHTPMSHLNLRLQKHAPEFTLTSVDRVHPGNPGNFAMAYWFLKGIDAPGTVSEVTLDAKSQRISSTVNAVVEDIRSETGGMAFTVRAGALPFPVEPSVAPALDWVPFQEDFNQEILRVQNLAPGLYTLTIDHHCIGRFTDQEFAQGINLALYSNTPQALQATRVLPLLLEWKETVAEAWRSIAQVEHWKLQDQPRPIAYANAVPVLEGLLKEEMNLYVRFTMERYLRVKPLQEETQAKIASLEERISTAITPLAHTYSFIF